MCLKVVLLLMCFSHLYALSYKSLSNKTHHMSHKFIYKAFNVVFEIIAMT
jgi:hypothetical protein